MDRWVKRQSKWIGGQLGLLSYYHIKKKEVQRGILTPELGFVCKNILERVAKNTGKTLENTFNNLNKRNKGRGCP